jgi:multiple sugar transport system permease protein
MLTKIKRRLSGAGFISLSLIGILVFYIVPFGAIIYYSMVKSPLDRSFVFLDNYKALLANTAFRTAAVNTLSFSALAVPLAVILSLCLALMLETNIPGKSIFRTFFLSPMMVPVASIVLIWNVIFHYNGALNSLLVRFGIVKIDWMKSELNQLVVVLLFLWKNLGYNMILFMAALNNMPKDLLEVAEIEGAGGLYKFFRIKLRYLSPTILFVTILSMINSFKVFREVYMLTGSYPFGKLYMLQHFMNNTFNSLAYQKLSAAAIVMCIAMIIIIAVLFIIENRFGKDVEG